MFSLSTMKFKIGWQRGEKPHVAWARSVALKSGWMSLMARGSRVVASSPNDHRRNFRILPVATYTAAPLMEGPNDR
jgi:hypothetical protein